MPKVQADDRRDPHGLHAAILAHAGRAGSCKDVMTSEAGAEDDGMLGARRQHDHFDGEIPARIDEDRRAAGHPLPVRPWRCCRCARSVEMIELLARRAACQGW